MNKTLVSIAVVGVMGMAAQSAHAAMSPTAVLSFTGTFGMEVAPGFILETPISSNNGIVIGTAQAATGSHSGPPTGAEGSNIDDPWLFFGNTGMHQSTSPIHIQSDTGAGHVTLDFSGWDVTWNGIASIPMGNGAWEGNPNGIAEVVCGNTCENGDTYTLHYSARVPAGDPSSFGNVAYNLNLTGTIGEIPIPAAVWLFGSGLLGLVGVARRKAKV